MRRSALAQVGAHEAPPRAAAPVAPAAATGTTKRTGSKGTQEHINIIYEHLKTRKARNRRQMTS